MATLTPFTGALGQINAAHLLRRATFKVNKSRIIEFANYTVEQAMAVLFAPLTLEVAEPLDYVTGQPFIPSYLNPYATGVIKIQLLPKDGICERRLIRIRFN